MTIGGTLRLSRLVQFIIVAVMILFSVYYLTPLYVMLVNSFKPLEEIRQGNMMSVPQNFSLEFWGKAW